MRVVGGRYGLSSKEFTPAMIKAAFDNIAGPDPKNHFTVGIHDDLSGTSLDFDEDFSVESEDVFRALFYGLGSDGTVGANKESIKIIGDNTANYAQGYFVYDSKKAGAVTVSHLRFGPRPIRSSYLISEAKFVACHQPFLLERYEVLAHVAPGGVFLLNTPYGPERLWEQLPEEAQRKIIERRVRFFVIDAHQVARDCRMGGRINTIMQTCFFAISGVLAARSGHHGDQGLDPQDLRQERRGNRADEPCGGGSNISQPARGEGARPHCWQNRNPKTGGR